MAPGDDTLSLRLRQMAARRALQRVQAASRQTGLDPLDRLIGDRSPDLWQHYPPGDLFDPVSGAQAYFHLHPEAERPPGEYGHIHLFLHPGGLGQQPQRRPLADPGVNDETAVPEDPTALPMCHLAAIGLDRTGRPMRVFTTNQWVTGGAWYATQDVLAMVDRFALDTSDGDPLVGDWLTALVHLLRAAMIEVVRARDDGLATGGPAASLEDRLADRRLEVLAERPVDAPLAV